MTDPLLVMVCSFEPQHTLDRALKQERAVSDGTVARLKEKAERGEVDLQRELERLGLLTMKRRPNHDIVCPDCGMGMEEVVAPENVADRMAAVRAVCTDFSAAIRRTREVRFGRGDEG